MEIIEKHIADKIPAITEILQSHFVKQAYFFGSICTDKFHSTSDIDILINFGENYYFDGYAENFWDMELELKKLLNREIDLVPNHTLKNPFFIDSVNSTKIPIYE